MEALTARQQQILRVIALEHIASAGPVGSEHIVRRYNLGASAATIRNEMAVLEAMGLIRQPHTSAGRVPTARGYRYFADTLIGDNNLSPEEQQAIRQQFRQIELDIQKWYELTASLLARYVGVLALVSPPHPYEARLKHLELVQINDSLVLLVIVLQDGTVAQHLVSTIEPETAETLRATSNRLNEQLGGKNLAEIRASGPWQGVDGQVVETLTKLLQQVDQGEARGQSLAGVANMLAQPEFVRGERARDIVELVESGALAQRLPTLVRDDGVRAVIGDEIPIETLQDCGLVISRYGTPEDVGGLLAVLGPTRMPYWRAITMMRYVRHVLDDLLRDLHA